MKSKVMQVHGTLCCWGLAEVKVVSFFHSHFIHEHKPASKSKVMQVHGTC